MTSYSNAEYFNMLMCLGRSRCNYSKARRDYEKTFGRKGGSIPSCNTLKNLHNRVYETGSVHGERRECQPRKITEKFEEKVIKLVKKDPTRSMRSVAKELGISHTQVRKILNENEIEHRHAPLTLANSESRKQYCASILSNIEEDAEFLNRVLFTDECGFQRTGVFSTHKEYVWATENPSDIPNNNHYRWRINVWAGLLGDRVIGPIFVGQTTNGADYLSFLRDQLDEALEDLDVETHRSMWFQHDGAPPHCAGPVRDYLHKLYPGRWIGRGGPIAWPSRSPDLSPLDIFWGFVKHMIYTNTLCETETEMTERIVGAFKQIRSDPDVLRSIREDIVQRYQTCINVGGRNGEEE